MSKKQLVVKNIHRQGKFSFESGYGTCEVEVFKVKGLENYYLKIDGRKQSFCKKDPCEMWQFVGEYLGIDVIEGDPDEK